MRAEIDEIEKLYAKNDPSLMQGKAFICFNRAEHRDDCYTQFKRTGFVYKLFGFGHTTLNEFFIPVRNHVF